MPFHIAHASHPPGNACPSSLTHETLRCKQGDDGAIHISVFNNETGASETVVVDALLVATGRKPNVTGVGLEEAGVNFDT